MGCPRPPLYADCAATFNWGTMAGSVLRGASSRVMDGRATCGWRGWCPLVAGCPGLSSTSEVVRLRLFSAMHTHTHHTPHTHTHAPHTTHTERGWGTHTQSKMCVHPFARRDGWRRCVFWETSLGAGFNLRADMQELAFQS